MANVNSALAVLADPVRKTLVEALRQGPLTVGELAAHVPVSRSAVSQHLQVLKAAELVQDEADGTRRRYSLQAATLGQLRAYVDALWGDALASFASRVEADGPAVAPEPSGRAPAASPGSPRRAPTTIEADPPRRALTGEPSLRRGAAAPTRNTAARLSAAPRKEGSGK